MANNPQDEFTLVSQPEDEFTLVSAPARDMGGRGVLANEATSRPTVAEQIQETKPIDAAYLRAAGIAGGGGFVGGYPISGPAAVRGAVTASRMGIEGIGTAAAQAAAVPAMATPVGPAAPSLAGAAAARFLNMVGQGIEYAVYGTPFDPKENEKATLMGAVPFYGPESLMLQRLAASGIAAPAQSALKNALITGGKLGTVGGLAEAGVEKAYTGEMPPVSQIGLAAALPFAAGTAGEYLMTKGSNLVDRVGQIADRLNVFRKIGVQSTPGMAEPSRFAGLEARRIAAAPAGPEAEQVDRAYGQLAQNINQTIPETMENRTVYDVMHERMTGVARAKDELDKLGPKVSAAQREADAALLDLDKSRERFFDDVTAANQKALDQTNEAILEKLRLADAKRLEAAQAEAIQGVKGTAEPLSNALARDAIKQAVDQMDAAYATHWNRMYSMFPDTKKAFDLQPILDQANQIFKKYDVSARPNISSLLRTGMEEGERETVASLAGLRTLRDTLFKMGRMKSADPSGIQNDLRGLANFVGDQIDKQAASVFGEEGAAQFRKVQADYRKYTDLWENNGLAMLHAEKPTDDVVKKIVNGIRESGSNAEEWKNLRTLIANMAEPQQARNISTKVKDFGALRTSFSGGPSDRPVVTTSTISGFKPSIKILKTGENIIDQELAARLARHINETLRANIIDSASDVSGVVPNKLISDLKVIGKDPKALEMLGFGTQDDVIALERLFKDNPRAAQLSQQQVTDAFRSVSLSGGGKATPAELLAYPIKASQIENQLVKAVYDKGIGRVQSAQRRVDSAIKTAADLNVSQADVERRLNQLRADPVYNFFGDPKKAIPGDGFNQMVKNLFSPAANEMTNADVQQIFTHLRNSKTTQDQQLLQNLQRAYLQEHLMSYSAAGTEAQAGRRMSVTRMSELMAPEGTVSPKSELSRMASVLEPEQIEAVRKSLKAADVMRSYERMGAGEELRKKGMPQPFQLVRRGYDAIADMIRNRDYDQAVTALLNPKEYANAVAVKGEWLKAIGQPIKAVAPTLSRFLPQQQQVPQNIQQFAQPQPAR